ncbi:hypothetical protein BV394_05770 [Brevirhabdus pacifica]|uniref:Uncharacterized protein n=1 Tax=Brevirhabdus pacifica TaxID=1267768 RepID=A0A1U7DH05_9RHOB|nr:DUF2244 domain-containing protein [Brevirhabdus pacifica]APX89284.1 hypothetical protein BV394_05770 [Brevirhabdus pacifica]OWU76679.1 hypothetical protein ATO5_10515 [Loktanella sp. 22II-4b]PJJ86100.1 putative membrane protein [Brevirhabdus pacifica]
MPVERDIDRTGAPGKTGALSRSAGDGGPDAPLYQVRLRPHRSLSRRGFATFIVITCLLLTLPLMALLGSAALWVLLPFLWIAVAGVWFAIHRSWDDGRLTEVLTLWPDRIRLHRENPRGAPQEWEANPYWTRLELHAEGGPVENYITLNGGGRCVELGAFLSPEERLDLHGELARILAGLDINARR